MTPFDADSFADEKDADDDGFDAPPVSRTPHAPRPDPLRPHRAAPPTEPKPAPREIARDPSVDPESDLPTVRTRVDLDDVAVPTPAHGALHPASPRSHRAKRPACPKPAPPAPTPPEPTRAAVVAPEPDRPPVCRSRARPRRRLAVAGLAGVAGLVLLIGSLAANTRAETKAGATEAPSAKSPLPAPPPRDPVSAVGEATAAEQEIGKREAEALASLRALDLILRQWKPGDLRQEHRAIAEYKKVVQSLRAFADQLIRGHDGANKAIQAYRAALERAPEKLDAAAAVYGRYAAEEPVEALKSQYALMGEKAKEIAAEYAKRAKTLELTEKELTSKMEFVRRSRIFLDRLDAYLDLLVAGQSDGAELQKYLEQLHQYIAHFETSLQQFKAVTDRIAAPAPAPVQPKK